MNVVAVDAEFEMLLEGVAVLLRRNGWVVVDHRGHPINYWIPDVAIRAAELLRATDPIPVG